MFSCNFYRWLNKKRIIICLVFWAKITFYLYSISYQSQPGTQKKNTVQVKLTADEKNWAEQMGISEKDYLKYKLEDQVNKKRA